MSEWKSGANELHTYTKYLMFTHLLFIINVRFNFFSPHERVTKLTWRHQNLWFWNDRMKSNKMNI